MTIPIVSSREMQRLWDENRMTRMTEKRALGLLSESIAWDRLAGDPALPGVRAKIIKLLTLKGQHIGTVKEIVNADGSIRESHPKDYTRRNCSRVRIPPKQE